MHREAVRLIREAFAHDFALAGNVGIFSQNQEEYDRLLTLSRGLTEPSDDSARKYFLLRQPIVVESSDDAPGAIYTHLYIRKPDPSAYGQHSGDIDFVVSPEELEQILAGVDAGSYPDNVATYEQAGVGTMVEVSGKDQGILAYVCTEEMAEAVRFRH